MKKIFTSAVLFIFVVSNILNAQAPEWEWAKSAGQVTFAYSDYVYGQGICTDSAGNSYTTGYFNQASIAFGNDTLTGTGSSNIFITKYDSSGNLSWTISSGGTGNGQSYSISIDANRNIYITGYYSGQITFGNDTLNDTIGQSSNIFIAKYDSTGREIWAKGSVGSKEDYSVSITTDSHSNSLITGSFHSPFIVFGNDTLINAGDANIFVVKFDPVGNIIWAKNFGGNGADGGNSICADPNGNGYLTGSFGSPAIIFGNDTLINVGIFNIFICKLDSSGKTVWARSAKGDGFDNGYGISIAPNGNSYITGDIASFNTIFGNDTLAGEGDNTIFTAKYDPYGNVLWAERAGGANSDIGLSIGNDANGNSYITGTFSYTATFGNDTITSPSNSQIFIAKYDSSGKVVWVKSVEGYGQGSSMSLDMYGNCYITGYFEDTAIFGNNSFTTSIGVYAFVAKLGTSVSTGIPILSSPTSTITVYPNPSTGQFYFKGVTEENTITISNILGQTIYTAPVTGDNYTVNLNNAAKGIYIYNVKNKTENIQQGKIVLE